MELALALVAAGKTRQQIALEIGYSRPAVSRYLSGSYGAGVEDLEAALLKRYERRLCPCDGEEKPPAQCRRIALRPRPHGFPDAETHWIACQTCPHKPVGRDLSRHDGLKPDLPAKETSCKPQ